MLTSTDYCSPCCTCHPGGSRRGHLCPGHGGVQPLVQAGAVRAQLPHQPAGLDPQARAQHQGSQRARQLAHAAQDSPRRRQGFTAKELQHVSAAASLPRPKGDNSCCCLFCLHFQFFLPHFLFLLLLLIPPLPVPSPLLFLIPSSSSAPFFFLFFSSPFFFLFSSPPPLFFFLFSSSAPFQFISFLSLSSSFSLLSIFLSAPLILLLPSYSSALPPFFFFLLPVLHCLLFILPSFSFFLVCFFFSSSSFSSFSPHPSPILSSSYLLLLLQFLSLALVSHCQLPVRLCFRKRLEPGEMQQPQQQQQPNSVSQDAQLPELHLRLPTSSDARQRSRWRRTRRQPDAGTSSRWVPHAHTCWRCCLVFDGKLTSWSPAFHSNCYISTLSWFFLLW